MFRVNLGVFCELDKPVNLQLKAAGWIVIRSLNYLAFLNAKEQRLYYQLLQMSEESKARNTSEISSLLHHLKTCKINASNLGSLTLRSFTSRLNKG